MSETGTETAAEAGGVGTARGYSTPVQYVKVAVVLFLLTGLEVWLFYLEGEVPKGVVTGLLLVLASLKLILVASFYMHLKEDKPLFRRMFVLGLVAAIVLYTAILATFGAVF